MPIHAHALVHAYACARARAYPNVHARYYTSDMVLHVDSNPAYLVMPRAKSRVAGYFHLTNRSNRTTKPFINSPIKAFERFMPHKLAFSSAIK